MGEIKTAKLISYVKTNFSTEAELELYINMFEKEGEGFFENGSSPYESGDFYESDVNTAKVVWNEKYDELFNSLAKSGGHKVVESKHIGSIRLRPRETKSSHGEKKKSR